MSPLVIWPSLPGSLSASLSWSPIQVRYGVCNEKASRPNCFLGSCVVMLGVLLGRPHIDFVRDMIFLSSFFIDASEWGTA